MKFKSLIVGAVMTAFSLLALAAPEAATPPAGSGAATATASSQAATPRAEAKPAKKAKASEQGKTRGLKSKKGKECEENGCNGGRKE